MNPRSALLVALVAAGYMYQPGAPTTPSRVQPGPQAPASGSSTIVYDKQLEVEDWPRETMHQFFTTRPLAKEEAKRPVCPLPGHTEVDFLIATVPDPQNSHYPVMFDRFVESIRLAFLDSQYVLDRFWLPWDADPGPPDTDWLKREHHQDWLTTKQQYPGILVFRSGTEKVLGVLLIGENPINGINKQQFDEALKLIKHFKGSAAKTVAVLGPTFSGSIDSLGIAMRDLSSDAGVTGYTVITGSATGSKNQDRLGRYDCRKGQVCGPGHPTITYVATIENDAVAFESFFSYLDPDFRDGQRKESRHQEWRREVELTRVAILAESGSDYASQFVENATKQSTETGRNKSDGSNPAKDATKTGTNGSGSSKSTSYPYLILDYPMEISRVRNAYEDDPELSVLSSSGTGGPPRQGLQIRLKDSHGADDSVPGFSTELTPVSQEAALFNTLATISRQRIEYVGIIATDILDSIFLGRMLKQHCPNVRLFLFDSDLVYAHTAQKYAFEGMMMVTSYPLFTANQRWTRSWNGQRQRRQFSSASGEGVYNACVMLLQNISHGEPPVAAPVEYMSPLDDSKPPLPRPALWLTVVGRDAVWPLTTLAVTPPTEDTLWATPTQQKPSAEQKPAAEPPPPLDETSRGWELGFWLLTLFCALFAAGVIYSNLEADDGTKVRHDRLSLLRVGAVEHRLAARLGLSAAAAVLLIAYGFVAGVQISYLNWNGQFSSKAPFLKAAAFWQAAVCVLVPALVLAAAFWCWRPARRMWMMFTGLASLAAAALFCLRIYQQPFSLFYVYRIVHVGNGVTPVVPTVLLSAALVWYAFAHLHRIRLCRAQPAGLPSFAGDPHLAGVAEVHASLTKALEHWWLGRWSWWATAALFLSLWFLNPLRVGSIEHFAFEWPYTAGLCVLYAGLLFGCVRFLHVWFDLRRILRMLERHPIREAFRRLPKELSPALVWRWGGGGQTYLTLAHSVERLRTLAARPVNHGFDYQAQLEILEANASVLTAADAYGRPVKAETVTGMHNALIEVSTQLAGVLESSWSRGAAAEAQPLAVAAAVASSNTSVTIRQRPAASTTGLAEEFVALRFVAMIRHVTLHLKNLLEFVAGALILAIVSLNSYPFQPHHDIITAISMCFFALGIVFLTAIVQMNRNTIMSYLADTKPGKLDSNLLHVLSFGALPLVTVLASQFPAVGGFLFSWVKPALETLR